MPKIEKNTKKTEVVAESGVERSHDLPWNEKKVLVFKLLKSSKLPGGSGSAKQLVDLSNGKLTGRDVRHYCYHAKAGGLVKVEEAAEGQGTGYVFSLTAAGRKIEPEQAFKSQQEARKSKPKAKAEKAKPAAKKPAKKVKAVKEAPAETAA